jgi:hypothetical protein
VVIYTCLLAIWTDLIMVHNQLWSYHGLPQSDYSIPLLLGFGIYPVVAYLFTQGVPLHWLGVIKRTLVWTFFVLFLNGADILIYLSIWGVYLIYRPAYVAKLD